MKLEYFHIKGFRRIFDAKIYCGDATFLIGENNIGKSSSLKALEYFFSDTSKLEEQDFFKIESPSHEANEIILEGKFVDLPEEANTWRGFKGRVIQETEAGTVRNCIYYRKTFTKNGSTVKREMKSFGKTMKPEYTACRNLNDFIQSGIGMEEINEIYDDFDKTKTLGVKEKEKLDLISTLWELNDTVEWANNPGGIDGNILIKLPKFLLIPAENRKEEIDGTSGTLQKTMKELFEDVRDVSENYTKAQEYLNLLAQELDPNNQEKEFGKMIVDINRIISGIFSNTQIHITANLSDPSSSIKPAFDIEMSSNVRTTPSRQGMGSIRSTVFALLRYRETFIERKRAEGQYLRPIIIGFEEPEMYLHPNAASLMRDKIYDLAISSNSKIICTTHSPYMIDLGKKIDETTYPQQILNLFKTEHNTELNSLVCKTIPLNITTAYKELAGSEKDFVKFLLKLDDNIAKIFFCKNIIIVEGDTEEILIKETVSRLPEEKRKIFLSDYQVVKARGKATIISLVKYLRALDIIPFVIHDKDTEPGAIQFNAPILEALGNNENQRIMIENTIEDILGYAEPSGEKPYKAFKHIQTNWGQDWSSVQGNWRTIFETKIARKLFQN